jgi:cellulose synthase/poly-beta-1,6-N-acetylglucosamine synthase-like glycosyltransferase
MIKILFWILLSIVVYAYFGYTVLLLLLIWIKKLFLLKSKDIVEIIDLPEITLLIAAYNEKDIIEKKMQNSYELDYPSGKLKILWITDGSDDGTPDLLLDKYKDIQVLHQQKRDGKTAALNRAMSFIKTPFVIFCDANTMLHTHAAKNLIKRFNSQKIGCVAGEKRISSDFAGQAAGAGEGTYWKYESMIKKLESDFHSTLGAAGELYAIRTDLFERIDEDMIIDDFVNSLNIARKGFLIKYAPDAFASESPSFNIKEELKRKIRIASGGFQTIARIPSLFNIFKYGFLSIEYISHKVLRWTVVPFAIPLIFIINLILCYQQDLQSDFYNNFLMTQLLFYLMVFIGLFFGKRWKYFRIFFLPYYLIIMNYAQIAGLIKYIRGRHSVVWVKVKRS